MEGVNPAGSAQSLLTNESSGQIPRMRDEREQPAPGGAAPQEPPRVNEGPSTVTTISAQARQLAEQEQVPGADAPAAPQRTAPADNAPPPPEPRNDAGNTSEPQAPQAQQQTPPAQDNGGRVVDDASPNDLLRN